MDERPLIEIDDLIRFCEETRREGLVVRFEARLDMPAPGLLVIAAKDPVTGSLTIFKRDAIVPLLRKIVEGYETGEVAEFQRALAQKKADKYLWSAENPKRGFVYFLRSPHGFYKIGRAKDPSQRVRQIGVHVPFTVEAEHLIECSDYFSGERLMHVAFGDKREGGEWFRLSEDDLSLVKQRARWDTAQNEPLWFDAEPGAPPPSEAQA